jgi:hypothetical protein
MPFTSAEMAVKGKVANQDARGWLPASHEPRCNASLVVFVVRGLTITCISSICNRDHILLFTIVLIYLSVSVYTLLMMGKFKKPGPKAVIKCEDCGRSFGNERALGQHLYSKSHAPVTNHDEEILPIVRTKPVAFDTPSPLVPKVMDFDDKPTKEVEFTRHEGPTSKLYILTPLPGKGQGLIAVQDISRGTRILSEKPLFRIPSFGSGQPAIEKTIERKLNLLSQDDQRTFLSLHNNTPGGSYPLAGVAKTNALPL